MELRLLDECRFESLELLGLLSDLAMQRDGFSDEFLEFAFVHWMYAFWFRQPTDAECPAVRDGEGFTPGIFPPGSMLWRLFFHVLKLLPHVLR